ncbi:MAG: hypothetical protein Q8Q39_03040 [bacterium]|nr:hypothetical protein [bacterium]
MYGVAGGCTTLFHLAVLHPLLVAVLGLASLGTALNSLPNGPGDRLGADGALSALERRILQEAPQLANTIPVLRAQFDREHSALTEEQARAGLALTDACTDANVEAIMSDPYLKEQMAWLIFLDAHARASPRSTRSDGRSIRKEAVSNSP